MAKRFPSNYPSKQNDEKFQFKMNGDIRVPDIRLVGDNLDEVSQAAGREIEPGIYPTRTARNWAEDLGLDLVMISPNADPPVCRIIEFNKFLYNKRKKEKEIKANTSKTVIKEIRFGPNTDEHDFEFKVKHAQKFLDEGSKVKAYVHFRGRTIVFKERGELLLLKLLKETEEYGAAEALPKMEGRRMIVILAPKKKK